jgi:hypothetical protein
MPRKSIAPWSERVSEGLIDQPIDSQISSTVDLRPTVDTGFIDLNGTWKGNRASDTEFGFYHRGNAVPNGETELASTCDMTGFKDIQVAVKVSNAGNYAISAVMGPDTEPYANLSPVDAAATLLGNTGQNNPSDLTELFNEDSTPLTADKYEIFIIQKNLADQKRLQFKFVNNSGGDSDIEVYYLRIV